MTNAVSKPCRAMHGISTQVPTAGSMTTSRTHMENSGIVDATQRLAQDAFKLVALGIPENGYLHALDGLALDHLTAAATASVKALPLFSQQPRDLIELEQQLQLLNTVELERPGADSREILNCIWSVVEERIAEFRDALQRAFDSEPGNISTIVEACRVRLKDLVATNRHPEKLRAYRRLVDRLRELPEHETQLLPEVYAEVQTALLQAARAALDEALTELAARKTAQAIESRRSRLESILGALDTTAVRFRRQISLVNEQLGDECKQARRRQAELKSSLAICLAGPDAEQVLAGCRTKSGCTDMSEFLSRLVHQLEAYLRECVIANHSYLDGANASLASLITDLPNHELIQAFRSTLATFVSDAHTLFQAIRVGGLDSCATRLWERAAPTCFTSEVDDYRLGIAPVEYTLIQLPLATNAADEDTRNELVIAFQRLAPGSHVMEAPQGQDVLVTRVLCGQVIGIDEANPCLLQRYVESDEIGHAPHLVHFFPDSANGEVIPATVRLVNDIGPHSQRNIDDDREY